MEELYEKSLGFLKSYMEMILLALLMWIIIWVLFMNESDKNMTRRRNITKKVSMEVKYDKAKQYFEKSLSIRRKVLGDQKLNAFLLNCWRFFSNEYFLKYFNNIYHRLTLFLTPHPPLSLTHAKTIKIWEKKFVRERQKKKKKKNFQNYQQIFIFFQKLIFFWI